MKIAVIGCGIAGLSAACFLKADKHNVTLLEKFETPKPAGAGLLLQPTGLAVLKELGLREKIIASGSRIDFVYGTSHTNKRVIFDVKYQTLSADSFGLGIHRGAIFNALYEKALAAGIPIYTGSEVVEENDGLLTCSKGQRFGPFDLVIDAQGMRSGLRRQKASIKIDKEYPYGAVWACLKDEAKEFGTDTLLQKYHSARHMIGILPVGKDPANDKHSVAFFWSLRNSDYGSWKEKPLEEWKQQVLGMWPETAPLLGQLSGHDNLTYVSYRDVILKKPYNGRVVFIGDAAHCTSPQLGQGANLALMDALALSRILREEKDIAAAIKEYARQRKRHLRFYQAASRMLTPFFQSDSRIFPVIRDYSFGALCKTPYVKTEMVKTLAGVKNGVFTSIKGYG